MFIILGLVILIAAVVVGVVGVVANSGSSHALNSDFSIFGYHVTGSTGALFLAGIVVGAVGIAGLSLLLAGARRTSRRASAARQELKARQDSPIYYGPDATAEAPRGTTVPATGAPAAPPKRGLGKVFGRGKTVHQA